MGSHYNSLQSIKHSQPALATFARYYAPLWSSSLLSIPERNSLRPIAQLISQPTFWRTLEVLLAVITPIHEAQKQSESNHASLDSVAYRWHKIHAAWSGLQLIYEEVPWESLIQAFNNRHKKQVQGLHWLAWALNVENLSISINSATRDIIVSCIQSLLPPTDSQEVIIDYFAFRAKEGKFALNTGAHKLKLRGSTFWYYYQEDGCKLAHLAARVLGCIANSVPSERAFSAMNNIQTRHRSRLSSDVTDRLIFIYMNIRALRNLLLVKEVYDAEAMEELLWQLTASERLDENDVGLEGESGTSD